MHGQSRFLQNWVHEMIETLRLVPTLHSTPPFTARLFGIIGVALYVAVQKTFPLNTSLRKDEIDGWRVGLRSGQLQQPELFIGWIEATLAYILDQIYSLYIPKASHAGLQNTYKDHQKMSSQTTSRLMGYLSPWDPQKAPLQYQGFVRLHKMWQKDFQDYLMQRDNDGWKTAQDVPADMPNLGVFIPVGNLKIEDETDLNVLIPDPNKFTLLKVYNEDNQTPPKPQKYLGPQFGAVDIDGFLSTEKRSVFNQIIIDHLPTKEQRRQEVLDFQNPPSDFGRASAETWAGSFPGYYNPPSQMMLLFSVYLAGQDVPYNDCIVLFSSVCINIFVVAVVAWDLKYKVMQSRPIQDFRLWYPEKEIHLWDGTVVKGKHWLPYQPRDSPTPPFPDIPSGHSCFSSIITNTILLWKKQNTAVLPYGTLSDIFRYISPLLHQPLSSVTNGCSLTIPAGASTIDPGISPTSPVSLNVETWTGIAEMIGKSRVYGGIHTESSNILSQLLAQQVVLITHDFFIV